MGVAYEYAVGSIYTVRDRDSTASGWVSQGWVLVRDGQAESGEFTTGTPGRELTLLNAMGRRGWRALNVTDHDGHGNAPYDEALQSHAEAQHPDQSVYLGHRWLFERLRES